VRWISLTNGTPVNKINIRNIIIVICLITIGVIDGIYDFLTQGTAFLKFVETSTNVQIAIPTIGGIDSIQLAVIAIVFLAIMVVFSFIARGGLCFGCMGE
jgi:hypothetical protein